MRNPLPFTITRAAHTDDAVSALERVSREVRLCDEMCVKLFGVSGAQLRLLCRLVQEDGQTVNELGVSLSSNQSSVSQLLVVLSGKNLVLKQPMKGDNRVVKVTITASGRSKARRAQNIGRPLMVAALAEMSTDEVSGLSNGLEDLARRMESQRKRISTNGDLQ